MICRLFLTTDIYGAKNDTSHIVVQYKWARSSKEVKKKKKNSLKQYFLETLSVFTEQGLSGKEPASKAKKTRGIHMIEEII